MYKPILAALLLAFTLGALCPAPASATSTPRTESSYRHRRHRRRRGGPIIILGIPGNSNKGPSPLAGRTRNSALLCSHKMRLRKVQVRERGKLLDEKAFADLIAAQRRGCGKL